MQSISDFSQRGNPLTSLKPRQRQFAFLLAQGATIVSAARQIGIAEQTAHRWLKLSSVTDAIETYIQSGTPITLLQEARDAYVYTFAYPDGTVFYVGKGTGDRIKRHLSLATSKKQIAVPAVITVIRSIWQRGEKVVIRKPYRNLSDSEALKRERELIAFYGYEQLVNQPASIKDRIRKAQKTG